MDNPETILTILIGLEVHITLARYLGVLPIINPEVVLLGLKLAAALNMKISPFVLFDRKMYNYFDLPKGYQITQQETPLATQGHLPIILQNRTVKIPIKVLQLEEDTAKSTYSSSGVKLDFNRSGNPLIELVTEPVFKQVETVLMFIKQLQNLLRYLEISEAKMEKGQLRVDLNFSLQLGGSYSTPRYEIKNLNSLANIEKALQQEVNKHQSLFSEGQKPPLSQTLGFDEAHQTTVTHREKTNYYYLPERSQSSQIKPAYRKASALKNHYFLEKKGKVPKIVPENEKEKARIVWLNDCLIQEKLLQEKITKKMKTELPANIAADFALTLALPISHKTKKNPQEVAQEIIQVTNCPNLEYNITVQGYINFRFPTTYYQQFLNETLNQIGQNLRGEKKNLLLNIEYVSTNPTGYLHLAHFRHATVGDTLANVYQFCGYQITREYYINDRGGQITSLIDSASLYEKNKHLDLLTELEKRNLIYTQDGAFFFRSSLSGDDKDRVIIKQDGADHHGTIARLKKCLSIIRPQSRKLTNNFKGPTRFSKRAGNTIELAEALKYLQLDQLKFFLLEKDPNQPLSINTKLLKENQEKTRLYYIQYAHARCHQIFQKANEKNIERIGSSIDLLTNQTEREIFNLLIRFSLVLENVIEENKPHHLINYLYELART
ncbi:17657_t:CDS:2 [Cetraspora pellucida]|uniref:17657_t:CDS:1 n=1 Tax=Cetraspora pellucida TaxID=1433469 RepID=A0ACA9LC42_9GLOM|nr:17657_t:CDS:2 [Cetraspora pellucida]